MSRRPRREFTEEFKLQMVQLYNSGKSASEIVNICSKKSPIEIPV